MSPKQIVIHNRNGKLLAKYNQLKGVARHFPQLVDVARLNKALGIAMSNSYFEVDKAEYHTTTCTCGCADYTYSHAPRRHYAGPCKHILAENLLRAVEVAA